MKKFICIYGEFVVSLVLLIILLTAWPYIVIAYTINFWVAFCVGAGAVILFNIIMGKRLKKREAAYYRKYSGADKTK
ncbi:DUF935 domain-containing protein [Francisellaceae bacterium]|nr:DUF935 domain-containing protein [Francisellaceae bacterium]